MTIAILESEAGCCVQLPLEAAGPEVRVSVSSEDSDPSDLSSSLSSDLSSPRSLGSSPPATTSRQGRQAAWLRSVQQTRTSELEFVFHNITLSYILYVTQLLQLKQR